MSKCPICGAAIKDRFCKHCGYDTSTDFISLRTITPLSFTDIQLRRQALAYSRSVILNVQNEPSHEQVRQASQAAPQPKQKGKKLTFVLSIIILPVLLLGCIGLFLDDISLSSGKDYGEVDYSKIDFSEMPDIPDFPSVTYTPYAESVIEVSAGDDHTVGLFADGTVLAVGSNGCGQLDVKS